MNISVTVPSLDDFNILSLIGFGAFGKVSLISKKSNGHLYALKTMSKEYLYRKNMAEQIIKERDTLALSNCVFIVTLYYSFETAEDVHLVMEYMSGGDFSELLKKYGFFEESVAAFYISEVAMALDYLHGSGIIHRDIKPANFLMSSNGHLKLSDFGLVQVNHYRKPKITDFNINKNSEIDLDTPIQQTNIRHDQNLKLTRTPGQVLSLTSDFLKARQAFSCTNDDTINSQLSENLQSSITFISSENLNTSKIKGIKRKKQEMVVPKRSYALSQDSIRNTPNASITKNEELSPDKENVRGTPDYLAPEVILQHNYDLKIDWWSVGVCLYQFLIGFPPFNDNSIDDIFQNIINGRLSFPTEDEALSVDAVCVITSLLQIDPKKRPTLSELKKMIYFSSIDWPNHHNADPPIVPFSINAPKN